MILRTLSLEPLHGYGIGVRLEQLSRGALRVNAGSLFPAFRRLERDGQIPGTWQVPRTGAAPRYYSLTRDGRATLAKSTKEWEQQARGDCAGAQSVSGDTMRRVLRRALHGLGAIVRRKPIDDELDEELDAFLDAATNHHQREGRSPDEARRAARMALGSRAAVKDHVRDTRWESVLEDVWRDVVYGCRYLNQHRGFAAAAVLTLGLGIGISTAVFSVVNTVLRAAASLQGRGPARSCGRARGAANGRRGTPAPHQHAMVRDGGVAHPQHDARRTGVHADAADHVDVIERGAVRLSGALVSTNIFTMLGANAQLGRTLDAGRRGVRGRRVVLSASTWQRYSVDGQTSSARPSPSRRSAPRQGSWTAGR